MKVLGVDTSTMVATCAVLNDDALLGEYSLSQDMTHSENLVPMIKAMLDSLNLYIRDIDLYGVSIGPGSFTGLRIGSATMKSFAHVYDKPIIGISTLEGLAFNLAYDGFIVPMIDARRNRVYTAMYKWEKGVLINVLKPDVMEIEALINLLTDYDKIIVNGNGACMYRHIIKHKLKDKAIFSPISLNGCKASSIAELALLRAQGDNQHNYYNLVPEYMKESQAQRELAKKGI